MKAPVHFLLALTLLILPVSAHAESDRASGCSGTKQCAHGKGQKDGKARAHLKKIDRDGDRQISLEEAEAAQAERLLEQFETIDRNGDGNLSAEELRAHGKAKRDARRAERAANESE